MAENRKSVYKRDPGVTDRENFSTAEKLDEVVPLSFAEIAYIIKCPNFVAASLNSLLGSQI